MKKISFSADAGDPFFEDVETGDNYYSEGVSKRIVL